MPLVRSRGRRQDLGLSRHWRPLAGRYESRIWRRPTGFLFDQMVRPLFHSQSALYGRYALKDFSHEPRR